jgi:hypothetical protein
VNDTDARLWHPWLRINRVLRVMLHTRWSAEAWAQVRVEFRKALALRSQIRRAGWFIHSPRPQPALTQQRCRLEGLTI